MAKPQIKMGASITNYHLVKASPTAMLSAQCSVVGDVTIGPDASVFAGTQVRGDCEPIVIGSQTNVQENSCLHVSVGSKLVIGNHVTVGHSVTLHGCTIEDNVLVGMGSIVLDDAHIGRDSVIGAGSLVTQRKSFPPRSLIFGSPARVVRELDDDEIEAMVTLAADAYVEVARNMTSDGLLFNPPMGTTIWPPAPASGNVLGPGFFGGVSF